MIGDPWGKSRWTPRGILRTTGIAALVIVILMALIGGHALDFTGSPRSFFIYWTVFFILLLSAIALAVLDAIATIVRFRKEHTKLRNTFRRELREGKDAQS
jgi:hypothetical protein